MRRTRDFTFVAVPVSGADHRVFVLDYFEKFVTVKRVEICFCGDHLQEDLFRDVRFHEEPTVGEPVLLGFFSVRLKVVFADAAEEFMEDPAERVVAKGVDAAQAGRRHAAEVIATLDEQCPATGAGCGDSGGYSRDRTAIDEDITLRGWIRFHVVLDEVGSQGSVL
jgi:hypothetical protein